MQLDTFGKRLRVLRLDRGLSQIELREEMEKRHGVDIGETYISELERTAKMPMLDVAAAMAKTLKISLDYLALLMDDATVSYRHEPPTQYMSEEADEVAGMVDSMSPDKRGIAVVLVRNLLALPSERQRRQAEIKDMLESVERQLGKEARDTVEKIVRDKGLYVDSDT
jgi:transcriptional regulator with XRE-family HTH domain